MHRGLHKKIPLSLIVVALFISLSIFLKWNHGRGPGADQAQIVASDDCDQWASMNVKQKKSTYKTDPKRWSQCLCEDGDGCRLDRLYITGKVSR
jgi:hypothetical protein